MNDPEPALWIERIARSRDEAALTALYDELAALVNGLAFRITRDRTAAEEVTHDVFLKVWNDAASFDPARGGAVGWILTLTRSRAIDARRRLARTSRSELPLDPLAREAATGDSTERIAALHEHRRLVRRALSRVDRNDREVLSCAFFLGLSHAEIASRLAQPLGTVKTRMRRGMMKLRTELKPIQAGLET